VFRNEKPGPGRFRQFMQFDADTVGAASPAADAEICMMAADTMEALGIQRGDYVIKVNNRKVLDGVMEAIGLGGEDKAGQRLTVLRALDKYDRLGLDGVGALLGPGRKDESGDFTKGAGLGREQIERLCLFATVQGTTALEDVTKFSSEGSSNATHQFQPVGGGGSASSFVESNAATLDRLMSLFGENSTTREGVEDLRTIAEISDAGGYGWDRIRVDPSVVRGLEYYTGPVFEAELTFAVTDEDGRTVRFGSVGGGGRYDGLVGRFRGDPVPATGFSIGVSRLLSALQHVGSPIVSGEERAGPVIVLVMDRDRMADYARMVADLRKAGIAAEMYLGASGMKAQMKYADRRRAPCVVIQGSDELARGEVVIKDLVEGAEQAGSDAAGASHVEYKAARLAQVSAPTTDLVAAVGKILAAQAK
jgi:histidyl-tRNA synthetase